MTLKLIPSVCNLVHSFAIKNNKLIIYLLKVNLYSLL